MFLAVYSKERLSPLGIYRAELEEDIDELISDYGETCGGGQGERGWNIDIEIDDTVDVQDFLKLLSSFLININIPKDTYIKIEDDKIFHVYKDFSS